MTIKIKNIFWILLLVATAANAQPPAPTGKEGELYDQAVQAGREGRAAELVSALNELIAKFPKSPSVSEASWIAAKSLEDIGRISEAAPHYVRFAKLSPKDSRTLNALKLAALGYAHASETKQAITTFSQYLISNLNRDSDSERFFFDLCESTANRKAAFSYFESASSGLKTKPVALASFLGRIAEREVLFSASVRAAAKKQAVQLSNAHRSLFLSNEEGRHVLAQQLFETVKSSQPKFPVVTLVRSSQISQIATQWPLSLSQFEAQVQALSRLNSPRYAIAGWNRLARSYQQANTALQALTPSPDLTQPELEFFQKTIAQLGVHLFQDKALQTALRCSDYAEEFHLFTQSGRDCRVLLSELEPQKYPAIRSRYLPSVQANAVTGAELGEREKELLVQNGSLLSTGLFQDWGLATSSEKLGSETLEDISSPMKVLPRATHYGAMSAERKTRLEKWLKDEMSRSDTPTLLQAELQRTLNPQVALEMAFKKLEQTPGDAAWLNVVALSEMELGQFMAAEARLLARAERKEISPGQWNTLGVIQLLRGDEALAAKSFAAPLEADCTLESHENLGFLALKYTNGREAVGHFRLALDAGFLSPTLTVGRIAAEVQSGFADANWAEVNELEQLSKNHWRDAYFVLSLGYWLLDNERDLAPFPRVIASLLDERGPKGQELSSLRSALRQALADQASQTRQ